MKIDTNKLTKEIISNFKLINSKDIPNIPLYMDQVTTFIDEHLSHCKREDGDKALTKTMINNYAKNNLLPPPEKKKYTKEHIIVLTFIYYFKNFMSINDIKTVLSELSDKYFSTTSNINLDNIYDEICNIQQKDIKSTLDDINMKTVLSNEYFKDFPKEDRDFLQLFSLICTLSFDVYIKKQVIESIIDEMNKTICDNDAKKDVKKAGKKPDK